MLPFDCLQSEIWSHNKKKEKLIGWQKTVRRGHSLSRRDILPSRRAKGEKQWPWKDDMPSQCYHCRNNKDCCWATRIRGHGNRGVFSVPESIMLLLPYSNASQQRSCPLMYLSQDNSILAPMSALSLSHFLHPCTTIVVASWECNHVSFYVCYMLWLWAQVRIDAFSNVVENNNTFKPKFWHFYRHHIINTKSNEVKDFFSFLFCQLACKDNS